MVNFKVGDVVVYTGNKYTGRQVQPGVPKVVQSVSPCGEYLRVCRDDNGKIGGYPKKKTSTSSRKSKTTHSHQRRRVCAIMRVL